MSSLVLVVYHCKWRVWQKEWPSYSIFCSLVPSPGVHDVNELAIRQRGEQSRSRVRNNTFSHLSGDEHLCMGGSLVSSTYSSLQHSSLLLHLRLHSSLTDSSKHPRETYTQIKALDLSRNVWIVQINNSPRVSRWLLPFFSRANCLYFGL